MKRLAWGISDTALILAVVAWFSGIGWDVSKIDSYSFFPLLGLVAFSLMWAHYIAGALRRFYGVDKAVLKNYFRATSLIVIICILMHPALLMIQLYADGFGLPPQSYLQNYVASSLAWATSLGTISLIIFLLFELHRKFSDRSWWKYIDYAQIAGMVFIFIHALALGGEVQSGWYRYVWFGYGVSLLIAVYYIYKSKKG